MKFALFLNFLLCGIMSICLGSDIKRPRLAILTDKEFADAANLLTAQLSRQESFDLVERQLIDQVLKERELSQLNAEQIVQMGEVLKADGILSIRVGNLDSERVTIAKLVTRTGVILFSTILPVATSDLEQWAEGFAKETTKYAAKLSANPTDLVRVGIVNFSASEDLLSLESPLRALLAHRLAQQPDFVVVERGRVEELLEESVADSERLAGSDVVLSGLVTMDSAKPQEITVSITLNSPKSGLNQVFKVNGDRRNLGAIVGEIASETAKVLHKKEIGSEQADPAIEAKALRDQALSAIASGDYGFAEQAALGAWALGDNSYPLAKTLLDALVANQIQSTTGDLSSYGTPPSYDFWRLVRRQNPLEQKGRWKAKEAFLMSGKILSAVERCIDSIVGHPVPDEPFAAEAMFWAGVPICFVLRSGETEKFREQIDALRNHWEVALNSLDQAKIDSRDRNLLEVRTLLAPVLARDADKLRSQLLTYTNSFVAEKHFSDFSMLQRGLLVGCFLESRNIGATQAKKGMRIASDELKGQSNELRLFGLGLAFVLADSATERSSVTKELAECLDALCRAKPTEAEKYIGVVEQLSDIEYDWEGSSPSGLRSVFGTLNSKFASLLPSQNTFAEGYQEPTKDVSNKPGGEIFFSGTWYPKMFRDSPVLRELKSCGIQCYLVQDGHLLAIVSALPNGEQKSFELFLFKINLENFDTEGWRVPRLGAVADLLNSYSLISDGGRIGIRHYPGNGPENTTQRGSGLAILDIENQTWRYLRTIDASDRGCVAGGSLYIRGESEIHGYDLKTGKSEIVVSTRRRPVQSPFDDASLHEISEVGEQGGRLRVVSMDPRDTLGGFATALYDPATKTWTTLDKPLPSSPEMSQKPPDLLSWYYQRAENLVFCDRRSVEFANPNAQTRLHSIMAVLDLSPEEKALFEGEPGMNVVVGDPMREKGITRAVKTATGLLIPGAGISNFQTFAFLPDSALNRAIAKDSVTIPRAHPVLSAFHSEEIQKKDAELFEAVRKGDPDAVQKCLENGAQVDALDEKGLSPLILSVKNKAENVAKIVIDGGADVNLSSAHGSAPICFATQSSDLTMMKLLIQAGARISEPDPVGYTPLLVACALGNLDAIQLLVDHGVEIDRVIREDQTALTLLAKNNPPIPNVVESLIKSGANVNYQTKRGHTALIYAAYNGRQKYVDALLAAGADPTIAVENRYGPADAAEENGHFELATQLRTAAKNWTKKRP